MEVPSLTSRLLVTVMPSRWESQVLTSFSQNVASFAPSGVRLLLICAQNARYLQPSKSDVLCFQVLPGFVPTIFVFSRGPLDSPDRAISSKHGRPSRSMPPAKPVKCWRTRILRVMHAFQHSIAAHLDFVLVRFAHAFLCFQ